MKPKPTILFLTAVVAVLVAAVAAGCGNSDSGSTTVASASASADPPATTASGDAEGESGEEAEGDDPATSTAPAGGGPTLRFGMDEFSFHPDATTTKAGTVTISATNDGAEPHELVLTKSDGDPSKLPTGSDGSVDEGQLDIAGEVEEVQGGSSGSASVDLQPGKYVYFCNLPGHYASGMYGTLTVK